MAAVELAGMGRVLARNGARSHHLHVGHAVPMPFC